MNPFFMFNLGVDGFAIIVMLILIYTCFISLDNTQDVRYLRMTFYSLFTILFSDFFTWILDGMPGRIVHVLSYVDHSIYYVSQIMAVIAWSNYVQYRITRKVKDRRNMWITVILPLAMVLVLILTNPLNKFTFAITFDNHYQRGAFSIPIALLVMGYLLGTSGWVLYRRSREKLASTRREYMILAGFVFAPFIGVVIQLSVYGISLIWPLASISMLLLYINRSRDEISIDALTGLNNRGSLDKYMFERVYPGSEERLTLILMDVDKFKLINDDLGHDMGDVALREVSEIIRKSFSTGHNFISRYGGDEFVVLIPQVDDPRMIDGYTKALRSNLQEFNNSGQFPMPLSISCGLAFFPKEGINNPEDLIKAADNQMYEEKERHHASMASKNKSAHQFR